MERQAQASRDAVWPRLESWQGLLLAVNFGPGVAFQGVQTRWEIRDVEVIGWNCVVQFFPRDRRRNRSARTGSGGVGGDGGGAAVVAEIVNENAAGARGFGHGDGVELRMASGE